MMRGWTGGGTPACAALALLAVSLTACGDGTAPRVDPALRDTVVTSVAGQPSAFPGETVTLSPAVRVADGAGRPLANVPVTFEVVAGGGQVTQADTRTGTDGLAHVQRWLLGSAPGTNRLRASVATHAVTFDIVTRSPQPLPWEWFFVGAPLGDGTVDRLVIDPGDDGRWYATSFTNGLYVSSDTGRTWRHPISGAGLNTHGLSIDPRDPRIVYAAVGTALWTSSDRGEHWTRELTFPRLIRSLTIANDGTVYAAPQWGPADEPGVYRATDGHVFSLQRYGVAPGLQLLTWHLFENPRTGTLLAGNEIADHPQPYHPPLLRSSDHGLTWQDVTGTIPWHVTSFAYDSTRDRLYALTEGAGYAYSTDDGATWRTVPGRFGSALLADPSRPDWLYLGHFRFDTWPGGLYLATSLGGPPVRLGFDGSTVSSLAHDRARTRLYLVVYQGGANTPGIYTALVGNPP
jgi:hypothetical protein